MKKVFRYYVAGLLEGEGCFYINESTRSLMVVCNMTDKDVIDRLYSLTGMGTLHTKEPSIAGYKRQFVWVVARRKDVISLINELYSFMGIRRKQQISKMLEWDRLHPVTVKETRHGTLAVYSQGCRCNLCICANRKYQNEWYRNNRASVSLKPFFERVLC